MHSLDSCQGSSGGNEQNGKAEPKPAGDSSTFESASEPTIPSYSQTTLEYRASAPSGDDTSTDSEIDKMIAAVQSDIRNIQADEFPTRRRSKHSWSERAVPFPYNGVKKIMKAEEFINSELKRRSCQAKSDCDSKNDTCKDASGSCGKHPPNPFNFKAECGLLMGKASELLLRELAIRSYYESVERGKIVIKRNHVQGAIAKDDTDLFDFLIDVVPAESVMADSVWTESKRRTNTSCPNEVNSVPTRKNLDGSRQVEGWSTMQGGPITVAQAKAQLEILKNLVQQQQQQRHGQGNTNSSFSFSL